MTMTPLHIELFGHWFAKDKRTFHPAIEKYNQIDELLALAWDEPGI